MTLVIIGPPAAGKSRVGRRLAKRLDCVFTDTDKVITAEHGPIPQLFADHGEAQFRRLERVAVQRALQAGGVVSLGGGAVMDEETRRDLSGLPVILLTIEAEAVRERIGNGKRPLLTDLDSWRSLVEQRMPVYAALATHTVDTTGRPVDHIVEELADWCGQQGFTPQDARFSQQGEGTAP